ncbi:cell wall-active antibiotics response protein LiaF [Alteribacillus sp. HJP-4]|uniref:cell wall-active antibiotics response protein LiaF n=1 Tax=Alteribacillus sp. HJP-4 TaxID=2775394 RepID=UPI0035CD30FC
MSQPGKYIVGFVIIFIGLSILADQAGINLDLSIFIWPAIASILAWHFYKNGHKWLALLFLFLMLSSIIDDLAGILIGLFILYIGLKMLKRDNSAKEIDIDKDLPPLKKEAKPYSPYHTVDQTPGQKVEHAGHPKEKPSGTSGNITQATVKKRTEKKSTRPRAEHHNEPIVTPSQKTMFIGDFKLMKKRFALQDMNVKYGIGDIKIDLSKAIYDEGETVLILHGGIGDIDLYVPYDMDIAIEASATIGDLNVLGHREEGFNKHVKIETEQYPYSARKVKVLISVIIGDVDVRYV